MHDHHLDDLIIDNINARGKKGKSFLTILALLIVMLIVAIVLTGNLLEQTKQNTLVFEEESSEMIAPELQIKETKEIKKIVQKEMIENLSLETLRNSKTKVPKENKLNLNIQEQIVKSTIDIPKKIKISEEELSHATVSITNEYTQENAENTLPKISNTTKTTKKITNHQIEKIEEKPPILNKEKYYLQVGSFKKTPSTRFLSVITNSGFNYIVGKPSKKGIKKLLIGPYSSRNSAKKALKRVKDRINKSAFIVKK